MTTMVDRFLVGELEFPVARRAIRRRRTANMHDRRMAITSIVGERTSVLSRKRRRRKNSNALKSELGSNHRLAVRLMRRYIHGAV